MYRTENKECCFLYNVIIQFVIFQDFLRWFCDVDSDPQWFNTNVLGK